MIALLLGLAWADPRIDAASAALAAGDAATAETAYRSLLDDGHASADVYYNLGNILWRQDEVPGALLAWRRAAALDPRDPDVQANLDFARRNVRDRLDTADPAPWFAPWQVALTAGEACWLGAGLVGLALGLLALRHRLPHLPVAGVGLALLLVGGVVAGGGVADRALPPVAVVLAPEVTATSDLGGGVDLFTLHAGAEVLAAAEEAGSLLVQLPDGRKGWVRAEHIGVARPDAAFPVL